MVTTSPCNCNCNCNCTSPRRCCGHCRPSEGNFVRIFISCRPSGSSSRSSTPRYLYCRTIVIRNRDPVTQATIKSPNLHYSRNRECLRSVKRSILRPLKYVVTGQLLLAPGGGGSSTRIQNRRKAKWGIYSFLPPFVGKHTKPFLS